MSRVDPGGLLTGGTPGLVKRCPHLSWVFLFCLGSGWALSPHSLWPCVCSLRLPVSPHVASGRPPLSFGEGLANVLGLIAFIAVNLAVMNMLPIPALDGGHIFSMLLFWLIGKIILRQPSPKIESYIHAAGLVLLLGLMAFVMFNDIRKIFV